MFGPVSHSARAALLIGGALAASVLASTTPGAAEYPEQIPAGYRDWRLISVAHEEGSLHDIRAILGNDIAIKAYREAKLPFPEGTIIARIAWAHVPSEENDEVFGRARSFVPGPAPASPATTRSARATSSSRSMHPRGERP